MAAKRAMGAFLAVIFKKPRKIVLMWSGAVTNEYRRAELTSGKCRKI